MDGVEHKIKIYPVCNFLRLSRYRGVISSTPQYRVADIHAKTKIGAFTPATSYAAGVADAGAAALLPSAAEPAPASGPPTKGCVAKVLTRLATYPLGPVTL